MKDAIKRIAWLIVFIMMMDVWFYTRLKYYDDTVIDILGTMCLLVALHVARRR